MVKGKDASKAKSPKAAKAKAKKLTAKPSAAEKKTPKRTARLNKPAARPKSERARRMFIEEMKVTSLHSDDIEALVQHGEAVLKFRRTAGNPAASFAESATSRCYEKVGDSNIVDITDKNGNDFGQTTQEDADARGILPCG